MEIFLAFVDPIFDIKNPKKFLGDYKQPVYIIMYGTWEFSFS